MKNEHPPVKILLVDDKEANLLALEALLSDLDVICVKVTSGKEALKSLLDQEFALILLDVKMPGMDGFETAEIIRKRQKNEATPIIFVTAYNPSENLIFKGYALGAVDYIVKPIIPEILISKVKVFIQLFQQNNRLKQEIKEHKRTQEALFFEKELAQITLKSIGDAVITTNAQGNITSVNSMAEYLTGWSETEAQGLPLFEILKIINELTQEIVKNPIIEALEQVKIVNLARHTILIARDGRRFPIDDSAAPIKDSQGNVVGAVIVFRDITDYKRQEETKLSNILNSTMAAIASYRAFPDGAWVFDYWSQGSEIIFGYTAEELIADQNLWVNNVHPEDLKIIISQGFEDFKLKKTSNLEYRFYHKDGTLRWITASLFFEWDQTNNCWNGTGVLTDMTERKQSEIALREAETIIKKQEEQLRLALEMTQTGIWDWHLSTGVIYWNTSHYTLLGYQPGEVESSYEVWRDRLHPDDINETEQIFSQALENHTDFKAEYRVIYSDGTIHWLLGKGQGLYDAAGQPVRMIGTIVDITQSKQTEIALQESEQKLSLFVRYAPVSVAMFDNNMRYIAVSQRWVDVYQFDSIEAVLGRSHYDLLSIPERWRLLHQQGLTGVSIKCDEDNFILPDGSLQWLKWEIQPWQTNTGDIGGILIFVEDISDRKQAEIALQEQIQQKLLVTNIAQNIRQTLDLNQILQTTVAEIQELLKAERVLIYRFNPDGNGTVIAESLTDGFTSMLSQIFHDDCCIEHYFTFSQADFYARTDIFELEPCFYEFFAQFQVKASLTIPITHAQQLWGYLIVHQCSTTRQWQTTEIELLQQLAIQVSIAIQQSELYQQTRQELLDRKKAQKALFDSEERLKAILEYAPTVIFLMDLENKHILVNQRYAELLLTTAEQLLGQSIYDVWPKETADIFAANNFKVVQNKSILETEEILPQSDGLHTYITWKFPIYDQEGKIYAVCGISTDITERKKAEQKIAQQAVLIDIATDAIFVQDLGENRILFWNKGAERLYGWTEAEILDQDINRLADNNNSDLFKRAIDTTIKTGSWQGEFEQLTKTGQKIMLASRWSLVTNDLKQPQSILVVNTDITEKKQLEKQFYQAQRLESIGTLASGIAHDLNNVFTPILGIVQLLPLRLKNLDQRTMELIKMLESSVNRGTELVRQILNFGQGRDGKKNILELNIFLKELTKIMKQTLPKSISISLDIPTDSMLLLEADHTQIYQIFLNLIINARDAMPNGGEIKITAQHQFIDLMYAGMNLKSIVGEYQEGKYILVKISDTGMGMEPEVMEHIFDPFFTTKAVGKGTGLGLATVLGIVKNHQGFLQVLSEVGKGTEFKVYLPAIEEVLLEEEAKIEENLLQGNGELVLIVDDEPFIRKITQISLQENNYETMIATDGIEAIAFYTKHQQQISAVLIDIVMPNINGLNAILTLKSINPHICIIANSGLEEHRPAALEAGALDFLLKPYTIQDLLKSLKRVCG